MTGVVLVLSTAPAAEATALADSLLAERLVACVNLVGPLQSRYTWQGRLETASEMLLLMKTTAARLAELRARLVALHPYQVPEVLAVPVADGHGPYLEWVVQSCRPAGSGPA